MPELSVLLSFILAALAMQTIPGPDLLIVMTRGVTLGKKNAFHTALGIAAAGFVQIPILMLGIGTIFQTSSLAYSVLKYTGAIYLIYIGLKYLFNSKRNNLNLNLDSNSSAFYQGLFSNLLNPKVLVFLLAFFPQFIDPARGSVITQTLILGIAMKCSGLVVTSSVAVMADKFKGFLSQGSFVFKWQQKIVGGLFTFLGLKMLFSSEKSISIF